MRANPTRCALFGRPGYRATALQPRPGPAARLALQNVDAAQSDVCVGAHRGVGVVVCRGTGQQPLSGFAVSRLVCVAAEHQVAQRAGVARLQCGHECGDLVQPTLGEQEAGSPQQSGVADRPARRQRSSPQEVLRRQSCAATVDLVVGPVRELVGQLVVGGIGGGHPVRPPGDTTEVYGRRAMQRLTPRRRQVVVNREPVERVREVDRGVVLPRQPAYEAGLEQALQRNRRLRQAGDPCDQRQRAALAQHRQRRRQLSRLLGQLGQRGDGRG